MSQQSFKKKNQNKQRQPQPKNVTQAKKVLKPNKGRQYIALFVILVVVFITYLPSLHGTFVWDDDHYLQHDSLIYNYNLKALFSTYVMGNYHPLTMLVYTIEYHFFGLSEKGYHVVNLIIHLLNIMLVFYAILLLSEKVEVALVASLLFGIHPMHVESVAWASELKDLLYTFFFLAAYICYLKYVKNKKIKFYFLCLFLFLLSLFSKGMAACFPVVLVLTDYFAPYLWAAGKARKVNAKVWIEKAPFFALAIVFGIVAVFAQASTTAMQSEVSYILPERIVIACYGFISYLFKLVLPVNLCAFYPYPVQGSRMSIPVQYYIYALLFLTLVAGVYFSFRFTKKIAFGLGFFLVAIFLVLQLLPVGSAIMADRYSYLSSVGIFYLAGEGFYWLWNKKKLFINPKVFASLLLGAFSLFYYIRTQAMCQVWKNSQNLWSDVIRQYQTIPYAYNNLGVIFMTDSVQEALADFTAAINLQANYPEALNNRGVVLMGQKRYDEALNDFNKAIDSRPGYAEAYNHRGLVLEDINKYPEALESFNKAIEYKPDFSKAYYNRGTFFINQSRYDDALNDYNKAIEIEPNNIDALNNRGNLLSILKKYDEAMNDYSKVIALNPDNINAHSNRALLFVTEKKYYDAIADYNKVIDLQPNSGALWYNRAMAEYNAAKKDNACADLQQAIKLSYQPASGMFAQICH